LSDEVHHGEEQERLVRCAVVGDRWVPIPASVRPELRELLEVFLKHRILRPLQCYASRVNLQDG
jgi:hypothetical protein